MKKILKTNTVLKTKEKNNNASFKNYLNVKAMTSAEHLKIFEQIF